MTDTPDLTGAIAGWTPEPREVSGRLDPCPVAALAAALDLRRIPNLTLLEFS